MNNSPPPGVMTFDEAKALHDAPPPPVEDAIRTYYRAVRASLDVWYEQLVAVERRDETRAVALQKKSTQCAETENMARRMLHRSIQVEYLRERGIV
jgi:hypothetical protein